MERDKDEKTRGCKVTEQKIAAGLAALVEELAQLRGQAAPAAAAQHEEEPQCLTMKS